MAEHSPAPADEPDRALAHVQHRLHQAADQLRTGGHWHQLCLWAAHNPQLSAANLLLAWHSGHAPEPVAAAASWHAAGRALRPDAVGLDLLTRLPATGPDQPPRWRAATVYPDSHTQPTHDRAPSPPPARSAEQLRDHLAATAHQHGAHDPARSESALPEQVHTLARTLADRHTAHTELAGRHQGWIVETAAHVLALRADRAHPSVPAAPPSTPPTNTHAEQVRLLAAHLVRTVDTLDPQPSTVEAATVRRVQHARARTRDAHQRADYGHARTHALTHPAPPEHAPDPAQLAAATAAAADYFAEQLARSPAARTYLQQRLGTDLEDLPHGWRLGYAPAGWRELTDHLRQHGFSDTTLTRAGLAQHSRGGLIDRFRGRLTIGIHDQHDRLAGFTARSLDPAPSGPKYLNTPTSELYDKSTALLGLTEQRATLEAGQRQPLLVEGPLDALALAVHNHEHPWAPISTCGTSLTTSHLTQLRHTSTQPLTLGLDDDAAGHAATTRIARLLYADPDQPATHILTDLAGHDPADALATGRTPTETTDAASWLLQRLLDQHQALDHPDWVPHQAETLHAAAELLAPLPTSHAAPLAAQVTATLTNLPNDTITSRIIDAHLDHQPTRDDRHLHNRRSPSSPPPQRRARTQQPHIDRQAPRRH